MIGHGIRISNELLPLKKPAKLNSLVIDTVEIGTKIQKLVKRLRSTTIHE